MSDTFLSRLVLDPMDYDVQRDLANCHALHQRIMKAFPTAMGDAPRAEFGILYRLEAADHQQRQPVMLVQSEQEPNWNVLPAGYLVDDLGGINPAVKDIGAVYKRLTVDDQLRFRLRANPTRRVLKPRNGIADDMIGKRVQLFGEGEQKHWLERKGEQHGFRVDQLEIHKGDRLGARQTGRKEYPDRPLTFQAAVFEGLLTVTDPDQFRAALISGIGPGKAYGFGLLSIAPVRT
ncbi:MAG: type I-E CRISPR-associated protein Cas6/Cse3/CasE [Thermomicrobiales bacterium]|nr:type I-E CRISPR-associated protein Cas6/Cse3/CasE [Thermomicrobiales bacterium]